MAEPKRPNSLVFNEAMLKGFINGTLEPAVEEKIASLLEARPDLLEKISAKSGDGFLKRLREVQKRSVEKSPAPIKAEVVATAPIKKAPTKSDSTIPEALANYAGYKIVKELGRGGMGVVYLAKNIQMDRMEVLKVLNERLLDHEGAKERFLREIRAVSKLSHANIVTSYSILPLDNLLVFAMEYVHGIDLHQYTNKFKPLSIGLACSFAKQVAAGLEHAHEKRLVHRDIKPSNVIVYKSGGQLQLKILDFGLAKATSEEAAAGAGLTQDGTMLGTPEYMSPEQTMNAAKADIRADIYSLGCTLYYMLTGKPPFTGTHGSVLLAHSQREPTALNLLRPDVPIELAAVVSKMLAKDVRKRYQTPSEVAQSLLPFVNQTRSSAKPSVGESAASNTVNDLNGPERETSVEAPLSELLLEADSQALAPQPNFAAVAASMPANRTAPQTQKSTNRTKTKPKSPKWFLPTVIALGALIFFGALWQIASFTFRTPKGTIVVENMPADAEVLVDGQKMEIVWNAGKDKAEVSINAGTHQLRVVNQGNEIYGEKVSLKGGGSKVVTLSVVKPTAPDVGTVQLPTQPSVQPPTTPPTQPSVQSPTLGPTDALERKAPGRVDTDAPTEFTETAFAQVEEQAGLPRVLLIGDSISMGYTIPVRKLFAGKANVLRPNANCGPSSRGVKSIDDWLGAGKWDVIHFNFGLTDIVYYSADGSKRADPSEAGSRHQVLAEDYEKNLRTIVARLKMTDAELVWCSTTPVPEGSAGRVADESTQYNAIAEQVMKENGIAINDLHAFALSKLKDIQQTKNVHFKPEGSEALATQVTKAIEEALARRQVKTK